MTLVPGTGPPHEMFCPGASTNLDSAQLLHLVIYSTSNAVQLGWNSSVRNTDKSQTVLSSREVSLLVWKKEIRALIYKQICTSKKQRVVENLQCSKKLRNVQGFNKLPDHEKSTSVLPSSPTTRTSPPERLLTATSYKRIIVLIRDWAPTWSSISHMQNVLRQIQDNII